MSEEKKEPQFGLSPEVSALFNRATEALDRLFFVRSELFERVARDAMTLVRSSPFLTVPITDAKMSTILTDTFELQVGVTIFSHDQMVAGVAICAPLALTEELVEKLECEDYDDVGLADLSKKSSFREPPPPPSPPSSKRAPSILFNGASSRMQ